MGEQKEGILLSQRRKGRRIFLRDWNAFAAKTEFGIVLEYFCGIEVGVRIFLSEEKLDLENFCPIKRKGVVLEIICPRSEIKQVRRGMKSPVR